MRRATTTTGCFSRFIVNVPEQELKSLERICFQVEQAHWFYEDFVRLLQPNLPSFHLKTFSEQNILFYSREKSLVAGCIGLSIYP